MSWTPDPLGRTPGLPDDAFEHDGLITKRLHRAGALALLRPGPGQLLWDIGAGSGAVGIEWVRAAEEARVIAVERDPARAERARVNATRLAPPGSVEVRVGVAADVLGELPRPDAVFVGGGATPDVLSACWAALPAGGRIVVHAVTVETESVLIDAFRSHGGVVTRAAVESLDPVGRFLGWTPTRAVVQWAATRTGLDVIG